MPRTIVLTVEELECIKEQAFETGRAHGFSLEEVEALREEWVSRIAEESGRQAVVERRLRTLLAQVRALEDSIVALIGGEDTPRPSPSSMPRPPAAAYRTTPRRARA